MLAALKRLVPLEVTVSYFNAAFSRSTLTLRNVINVRKHKALSIRFFAIRLPLIRVSQ